MRISDWSSDVCSSDLQREAGEDGRVQIGRFNEPRLQRLRLLLIGRLQRLQRMGLADEMQPGTWAVHADAEKTLRALGERGDIIRTIQRAMRGRVFRSEEHTSELQSPMRISDA